MNRTIWCRNVSNIWAQLWVFIGRNLIVVIKSTQSSTHNWYLRLWQVLLQGKFNEINPLSAWHTRWHSIFITSVLVLTDFNDHPYFQSRLIYAEIIFLCQFCLHAKKHICCWVMRFHVSWNKRQGIRIHQRPIWALMTTKRDLKSELHPPSLSSRIFELET